MISKIIVENINKILPQLNKEQDTVMVLKGIPISIVDNSIKNIDLSAIIENKLKYFIEVCAQRRILAYEEFLLLADFVVAQYKKVLIINNNIYMEQYPIEEYFKPEIRLGILTHYADVENEIDNSYIGDIDEYENIFQGLKECNGRLIGAYYKHPILQNPKINIINLFKEINAELDYCNGEIESFNEIIEEADYIDLVRSFHTHHSSIYIRITNYVGDAERLSMCLSMLAYYWRDYTKIFLIQMQEFGDRWEKREEYSTILKRYWRYSEFRNISIYDIQALEKNEKVIKSISQECIIANLVEEVERCKLGKDFRDLFVTAPTGAGKSIMFQIPAIYLAEKYNFLTIVISPLIGLMNDQVKNLTVRNYAFAKTINSDISPIIKQEIIEQVAAGQYHILYLSPETLLSRSDVEQLIGDRTIGMIVVDEAHIVTTWGKQFRPDYWYLGDYIRKIRKRQLINKKQAFVVATFTATAIYRGPEDMYTETINSLHMLNPITYLGYVKRDDIEIDIKMPQKHSGVRTEYEFDKFEQLEQVLLRAIITNKKTLIYFPTVALINRCYEYFRSKREIEKLAIYHGALNKEQKQENYEKFLRKEKLIMLATKAFGMGIDIDDIELVVHFAPTGNVCDYVQEIGRAARKNNLCGEALYYYNSRDFKHINRLHGLSAIKKYQLIEVIKKISELYNENRRKRERSEFTKKRNTMLLDAENFSYIFGSPISDEDNNINKVKTALLLIQKDFEAKVGFSPIVIRPIPMFSIGFFSINPDIQKKLLRQYPKSIEVIEKNKNICRVVLSDIWAKDYNQYSFPNFKFMLYSGECEKIDFLTQYPMIPALCVTVSFQDDYVNRFKHIWGTVKGLIGTKVISQEHTATSEIVEKLIEYCDINKYKAQSVCEVIIASMDTYRKNFARTSNPIVLEKTAVNGITKYQFNVSVNSYFSWVEARLKRIEAEIKGEHLYIVNENIKHSKEYNVILGVLEVMGILTFEMLGGANSQLYIYVNQVQTLQNIINGKKYSNRLLEMISERQLISTQMLTHLYTGKFSSNDRWNLIEDYFLGVIPEVVKRNCILENPDIIFT